MGEQKPEKTKKHICAGLLAHVDAGKTTLAESLLYTCGTIRKAGRAFFLQLLTQSLDMHIQRSGLSLEIDPPDTV